MHGWRQGSVWWQFEGGIWVLVEVADSAGLRRLVCLLPLVGRSQLGAEDVARPLWLAIVGAEVVGCGWDDITACCNGCFSSNAIEMDH